MFTIYSRLTPELTLAKAASDYAYLHRKKGTHIIVWLNDVLQLKRILGRGDGEKGLFPTVFFNEKFFSQVSHKEYEILARAEFLGSDGRSLGRKSLEDLSRLLRGGHQEPDAASIARWESCKPQGQEYEALLKNIPVSAETTRIKEDHKRPRAEAGGGDDPLSKRLKSDNTSSKASKTPREVVRTKGINQADKGIKQANQCSYCDDLRRFENPYRSAEVRKQLEKAKSKLRLKPYNHPHSDDACLYRDNIDEMKKTFLAKLKEAGVAVVKTSKPAGNGLRNVVKRKDRNGDRSDKKAQKDKNSSGQPNEEDKMTEDH